MLFLASCRCPLNLSPTAGPRSTQVQITQTIWGGLAPGCPGAACSPQHLPEEQECNLICAVRRCADRMPPTGRAAGHGDAQWDAAQTGCRPLGGQLDTEMVRHLVSGGTTVLGNVHARPAPPCADCLKQGTHHTATFCSYSSQKSSSAVCLSGPTHPPLPGQAAPPLDSVRGMDLCWQHFLLVSTHVMVEMDISFMTENGCFIHVPTTPNNSSQKWFFLLFFFFFGSWVFKLTS